MSTLIEAVAASQPYRIMAMRIASARGKPLSLVRSGSLFLLVRVFPALKKCRSVESELLS